MTVIKVNAVKEAARRRLSSLDLASRRARDADIMSGSRTKRHLVGFTTAGFCRRGPALN